MPGEHKIKEFRAIDRSEAVIFILGHISRFRLYQPQGFSGDGGLVPGNFPKDHILVIKICISHGVHTYPAPEK